MSKQPDATVARRSKSGVALRSFAVVALTLVLVVTLAESALRVFDKYRPPVYPPDPPRPDIFVSDSALGYHLWPLTRTCMRYPINAHRMVSLISNADGFASSRELGEPDRRTRILVIGDSFTMGLGVSEGSRFLEVLEDLEPRWRVDNMGMPGWGLDLMLRALESRGKKAQPNVVVFAVYTESLARLAPRWMGQAPAPYRKFELVDGKLVDRPSFQLSFWDRFHLAELVRAAQERAGGTKARNRYPLNEALLDRFYDLTRELKATPVLLFFPGVHVTDQARERRAFLSGWAERKGVVYGDFTDPVHAAGVEKTYIGDNPHWNEYGHTVAARALHALLAARVLPGKGADIDTRTLAPAPWRQQRFDYCSDRGGPAQDSAKSGSQ